MVRRMLKRLGWEKATTKEEEWQEPSGDLKILPMTKEDVKGVAELERKCFGFGSWSQSTISAELKQGPKSCLIVARIGETLVGFAGYRQEDDEAHITNVAVHPKMRGRGIGDKLLSALLEEALRRGLNASVLEVRRSNIVAQNLYKKYGYQVIGVRRGYYQFPVEDALIMKLYDIEMGLKCASSPKIDK